MLGQLVRQVWEILHGELCHRIQAASVIPIPELTCDHKQADTRIALHYCHANINYSNIAAKSLDTDVTIIFLFIIDEIEPYVSFLTGVKRTERILALLDLRVSIGLHVFTGC